MKRSTINLKEIFEIVVSNAGDSVCTGDIACGGNWAMC